MLRYYCLTNYLEIHKGVRIVTGDNALNRLGVGVFTLSDLARFNTFIDYPVTYVREATIHGDITRLEPRKLFRLNNLFDKKIIRDIVEEDGSTIEYVDDPSEQLQLSAVAQNFSNVRFIEKPTELVQFAVVHQCGSAVDYITDATERIQLIAVLENADAIQYITNPSQRVQLAAVSHNGISIRHIANPSERVQQAAIDNNKYANKYIVKKCE